MNNNKYYTENEQPAGKKKPTGKKKGDRVAKILGTLAAIAVAILFGGAGGGGNNSA